MATSETSTNEHGKRRMNSRKATIERLGFVLFAGHVWIVSGMRLG